MAKPAFIELSRTDRLPILYEDRAVLAVDKPRGWMLVPFTWQRTNRNLQAAITSSIAAGHFWARSRNLKFLRHVHRLDSDTTGILLFAKSQGALDTFSELFETRQMAKRYLAVVHGTPPQPEWTCQLALAPDPEQTGRMKTSADGKPSETHFRVLQSKAGPLSLVEARPVTGRTHQIRVHLAEGGLPIAGDPLYGPASTARIDPARAFPMGLRAVELSFHDPFNRRPIHIRAPQEEFLREFGFETSAGATKRADDTLPPQNNT